MLVQKATAADQEQLVTLRIALQQHVEQSNPDIWHITKAGQQKLVQDVNRMLSDDMGLVLVAEEANHTVGFAYGQILQRIEYEPNKVGMISMVFIHEDHRRRGIGTHLIRELCNYFNAEKIGTVTLRYVLGNKEAEAFWHHLGFTPVIHTVSTDLKTLQKHTQ